ncbi:MAG TPA: MgtC/SapB family protein [Nevskiaceae bacterium]|nr:MgtC/SapB family protein [Nevskiaceae bacterium]
MNPELPDVLLRLGLATLIGAAIGLNRDLHGKPAGLRTHALVALGSALIVLACGHIAADFHAADAQSRAIQGIITGVGFIGAGVIVHKVDQSKVHGLTTAAAVWVAALVGAACGTGAFMPVSIAALLLALVLIFGGRIERRVHGWLHPRTDGTSGPTDS